MRNYGWKIDKKSPLEKSDKSERSLVERLVIKHWRKDKPPVSGNYLYTHKITGEVNVSYYNVKTEKWTPCQVKSWTPLPQRDL